MKERDELMAYQLLILHLVNVSVECRSAVPQWRKYSFFFFSVCVKICSEGEQHWFEDKFKYFKRLYICSQ